ncbi:MAG TPA: HPr family phosphocarrier protein [Candidatus Binataceae bacterium]|nr:HPr family phosphocarrier protein [Candidatus Binataceae bacterium]
MAVRGAGGAGNARRHCIVERQDVNVAEETVQIKNRLGLHLRAASTLAQAAAKFKSAVTVIRGKDQASARSVTALIMLGAGKGTRLRLRAEGDDAQAAVAELSGLFNDGFGEE